MQKCQGNEVLAIVVMLAEQSTEGEQFKWVQFCREAQEEDKTFHYALLLLSILLLTSELPKDSQFPSLD